MDVVTSSIGLAGTVLKLVVFTIEFVGHAKQTYKRGATDRNIDLSAVAESVQATTASLNKQLDEIGKDGSGNKLALEPDDEVSYVDLVIFLFAAT